MNLPLWTDALGWTLVHSLWQGSLLFLLYWLSVRQLSAQQARARYALALSILGALALASGLTLWRLWPGATGAAMGPVFPEMATSPGDTALAGMTSQPWYAAATQTAMPWLGLAWLLGLVFQSLRWGAGYLGAQRLRRKGISAVPPHWQAHLQRLQARLGLRGQVRLHLSDRVRDPLTLGFWRPVILIPVSMVSGLTPAQWEAILLHELAHIRRADYLIHLVQSLVELLFFFHPLTWFLSREISREREACCDDLAVAACGDAFSYAEALTRLQRLRFHPQSPFAMNLQSKPGPFTHRIQRLFPSHPTP
ncbi:MAG: M56 family metallopeptidase, partial [Bacteroidetes bacterium]